MPAPDLNPPADSHGYVTDASYADRFYRELSPAWLNYVASINGARPRDITGSFSYLELGCGFGTSTLINAGAFPRGEFLACDFNPVHIEAGQQRAAQFGIDNIRFSPEPFDRLLAQGLPLLDFIVLHGVYSWVAPETRLAIRRIIDKALKPGGLLYISYNCLPGWSVEAPLRKLLLELTTTEQGDSAQRAEAAAASLHRLSSAGLRYFDTNPQTIAAIAAYARSSGSYLAHEFVNQTWEPFYSIDISQELQPLGLTYAGSAKLAENHPTLLINEQLVKSLSQLASVRQRQLALDFAIDQRFRRDVFVRADAPLDPTEAARHMSDVVIGCPEDPARIVSKARVPRGEIRFQESFVRELQALLEPGSITMGEAVAALDGANRNASEIVRNLLFLTAAGVLQPFALRHRNPAHHQATYKLPSLVERVLKYSIERRTRYAIPSQVLGNGVDIEAVEAAALVELAQSGQSIDSLAQRLATMLNEPDWTTIRAALRLQSEADLHGYTGSVVESMRADLIPKLTRLGMFG